MTVHDSAARGFSRAADAYERGRPDYPAEAISWLAGEARLGPGRTVVDVGAGTGKLTRALVRTRADVVAVEPVAEMRAALERGIPSVRALDGTAESLPLEDATADAIVVGQAFHWFDGPVALGEFHRVLALDGVLALIWNRRDATDPLQRAISELIEPYRGSAPAHASGAWRKAMEETELFAGPREMNFRFEQHLDPDGLVDRVASISFVATIEDGERLSLLSQVRSLAAGPVALAHVTEVYAYTRAA